jgi:CBS domain-containing protein
MARGLLSMAAVLHAEPQTERGWIMKVKELMSTDVKTVREDADVSTATKLMWDGDCGIVPVVNDDRQVIGVVTDRDICIAAATRSMNPNHIRVGDVMSRTVFTVPESDDARQALSALKDRRVRRLPVVDRQRRLVGVISLSDLVARAECKRDADIPGEEFLDALKAISARVVPVG